MKRGPLIIFSASVLLFIILIVFLIISFVSEIPTTSGFSKSGNTYNCSGCSDCTNAIADATVGDIIQLNTSIADQATDCVVFNGEDHLTFDCQGNTIDGNKDDIGFGIRLNTGSNNNTIKGCNITEFDSGIYITSTNITVRDVTSYNNHDTGIFVASTSYTTIYGVTVYNNSQSGSKAGIYFQSGTNSNISNIITYNNTDGIRLHNGANNNVLMNITANDNTYGIQISQNSKNNNISNVMANNGDRGILINQDVHNNTLTNITSKSNLYGIFIQRSSDDNVIRDSRIESNSLYGIYFNHVTVSLPEFNTFYNNIINNTNNYYNSTTLTNYFNTAKTLGTNVVGGSHIAGNIWLNSSDQGNGFSETCTDADADDICDSAYTVDPGNLDNLPLILTDTAKPVFTIVSPSNSTYATGGIDYNISSSEILNTALVSINGGTNITLDNNSLVYFDLLVSHSGLTNGGHNATFYASDTDGNSNQSIQFFKVNTSASGSSGTSETGSGGTIPEPTESKTWKNVSSDTVMEMIVISANIDLREISIKVNQAIADASLKITKIADVVQANIQIGVSGENYQTYDINTTGLSDTNIENVTIEFRVTKTWLESKGASSENVSLYRKKNSGTEWEQLNTSLLSEDSTYYYFSAISSGFSRFMIFVGTPPCTPGEERCLDNTVQLCIVAQTWIVIEECSGSCRDSVCVEEIEGVSLNLGGITTFIKNSLWWVLLIIVVAGITIDLVVLIKRIRKEKNS